MECRLVKTSRPPPHVPALWIRGTALCLWALYSLQLQVSCRYRTKAQRSQEICSRSSYDNGCLCYRWRREDEELKVILGYKMALKPAWNTRKPTQKEKEKGKKFVLDRAHTFPFSNWQDRHAPPGPEPRPLTQAGRAGIPPLGPTPDLFLALYQEAMSYKLPRLDLNCDPPDSVS